MKLAFHNTIDHLEKYIPKNSGIFAVIDSNVKDYFCDKKEWHFIEVQATEQKKTLHTAEAIWSKLLEMKADKDCFVLGIGGGVTTDIAGFVASTYKRGVRFGLVPTTLLGCSDAAIGGKNGVNLEHIKNAVGTINQPVFTYISTVFFGSLKPEVFREGIVEILKTFLIYNQNYYKSAVEFFSTYNYINHSKKQEQTLRSIVRACAQIKLKVTAKDEKDIGERRLLNLGHTFAHALESHFIRNKKKLLHGQAVAYGINAAAQVSCKLKLCNSNLPTEIVSDFEKIGISCNCGVSAREILDAMLSDKKAFKEYINLILIKDIEQVCIKAVSVELLKKTCSTLTL